MTAAEKKKLICAEVADFAEFCAHDSGHVLHKSERRYLAILFASVFNSGNMDAIERLGKATRRIIAS